jgi:hypothetical protein
MSADDLLLAAQNEEPRLLAEIMKTDLYKRLEAVRTVISLYSATAETAPATSAQPAASAPITAQANGHASERNPKAAPVLNKAAEARLATSN